MILAMPQLPLRPCAEPHCPALVRGRARCEAHEKGAQAFDRARRGSSHARGYDARWRTRRNAHLAKSPVCVMCLPHVEPATEVDHIVPAKGNQALFDDDHNLQSLCKAHHSQKTAREDGGFGRAVVR